MKSFKHILIPCLLFISPYLFGQTDSTSVKKKQLQLKPAIKYNALSPAKAAFYSAVFPGGGQIYNNKYWWQLPVIYGGLGISIYFYIDNDRVYDRYRTAYRLRKAGLPEEFTNPFNGERFISDEGLENAQRQLQKNKDISLLTAVLIYVLQIVEASVTAHLLQFDTSDNLSLQPITIPDPTFENTPKVGFSIKYSF